MANLFDSPSMATGYAQSRPAVHPHIIEKARNHLLMPLPVERALDVGCGAGLSTRALEPVARQLVGIDPSEAMVKGAAALVPGASFVVGRAESLPIPSGSVDLISAAGSLNYADLEQFFTEAFRVLRPGGALLVYDFAQGKSFPDSNRLEAWFKEFLSRYPMPVGSGHEVSPEILGTYSSGLRLHTHEIFEIALKMDEISYLNYIMTETNVASAVSGGLPEQGIRTWCAETLELVFQKAAHEVLFPGYLAVMLKGASTTCD